MSEVPAHGTFANLKGSVQSKNIRDSRDELTISVSSSSSFRTSEALSKTGINICQKKLIENQNRRVVRTRTMVNWFCSDE
jgi:hypothetical protein